MTLAVADFVKETSTTTGTGTYTLAGAVTGFQSFGVVGNGNTIYYSATDGTNWEVGIGTYTTAGTTLARTTILASSNAGAAVSWAAGSKTLSCAYPSEKMVSTDNLPTPVDTVTWTTLSKPATTTITSNATLASDATLQFSMLASTVYEIEVDVYTSSGAGGVKWGITGPAAPTTLVAQSVDADTGAGAANVALGAYGAIGNSRTASGSAHIKMMILIINGTNAGTFAVQCAQASSNAAATSILRGSKLKYRVA